LTNIGKDSSRMKVTIGICVKDSEKIVKGAITSVLNQTFPHQLMETIFVDDGSKDSTLSVIKANIPKFDMSVSVYHHDWQGLGPSRNIIVKNAKGDYIIWVDGDMTFPINFVTHQVKFMEANPSVGIGKAKYGLSSQSNLVSDLENMEFAISNVRTEKNKNSLVLGAGGCICRTKALRQVGGFDKRIRGSGEDMDIEQRVRAAGWSLTITPAVFYENRRKTWKSLWKEYCWHGKGGSYLFKTGNESLNMSSFFPVIILKNEISRSMQAYRLTHRKVSLLLPLHYIFKRAAWAYGFLKESAN
jgi:glycosyltransferase involved in cell wall biosynthesis